MARGRITADGAAATLAALMPNHAIVIDEGITLRDPFFAATANGPPHDWLGNIGGAIGGGLPLATGAAIAAPNRRVITLTGDGSAMYAVQALWTQAREQLDVTTIILSNRKYAVLFRELDGVGAKPGPTATDLFALDRPGARLGRDGEKHGRGGGTRRQPRASGRSAAPFVQRGRPVPDRAPVRIRREFHLRQAKG